jgi:hypothetical protein
MHHQFEKQRRNHAKKNGRSNARALVTPGPVVFERKSSTSAWILATAKVTFDIIVVGNAARRTVTSLDQRYLHFSLRRAENLLQVLVFLAIYRRLNPS